MTVAKSENQIARIISLNLNLNLNQISLCRQNRLGHHANFKIIINKTILENTKLLKTINY